MTRRVDVRETYDRIAEHFAQTRPEPWPEVQSFLHDRTGDTGLDIGVGNGRHAELLADRVRMVIGLDISHTALRTAIERSHDRRFALDCVSGDASHLPIRNDSIDLACSIAVIHHLPTRQLRITSFNELARVLSPTGTAIVSAWATSHERFHQNQGFDTTIDWTLPSGEIVPRFYHIYDPAEFRADLDASNLTVLETYVAAGNVYGTVTK